MRTYEEASKEALPEGTFSNSSQWEVWSAKNCDRCVHDEPGRQGDAANGCPLILIALEGRRPAEWLTQTEQQEVHADYTCTEFRDENDSDPEPHPVPTPDGQGELVPREPYEGHRVLTPLNWQDRGGRDFAASIESGLTEDFDAFERRVTAADTTRRP
ncbi:hypothetical protein [Streptomyces cylindrosporus]|uniref:Uncharacterized protein n=1 Tax=Streptomyces cylindrosporus TaxID=2927583 RepID=A0ABS9YJV5_9ACTN|nr:hypothetical protein [Streptomyces cylindrosporus]MCI3277474.1 hypothetical protein [Streptomyces cylindrosporus]